MRLSELEQFNRITIQCHDNPDADALASGFGLYTYFLEKGKTVRLVYAGRNRVRKKNLTLMIEKLHIPISFLEDTENPIEGLLLTVDCQYGGGNVTKLLAEQVAVIDHHYVETGEIKTKYWEVNANLGSCSTLVWKLMRDEGFSFAGRTELCTALYYGLLSDTNQFSEMQNPLDRDMEEALFWDKGLIRQFKNSNLTLEEMEIAGLALIKHIYNENYRYAIVRTRPCDPNVLGLISDFLLQVDGVDICVVYNQMEDGVKFSVRSCVREVYANELAAYLAEKIGSGGGHKERAGGVLLQTAYEHCYGELRLNAFFSERLNAYFESFTVIEAGKYRADAKRSRLYRRCRIPMGYMRFTDAFPAGTPVTIRTMDEDVDLVAGTGYIVMIGIRGELYLMKEERFLSRYEETGGRYRPDERAAAVKYVPTFKNRNTGEVRQVPDYVKNCVPLREDMVYAMCLEKAVKVFTADDPDRYLLGKPGDYLVVDCEDQENIMVIDREDFGRMYRELEQGTDSETDRETNQG